MYLALVWPLTVSSAGAVESPLLATSSQNPFIQIYSLPAAPPLPVPGAGRWSWQAALDIANHAMLESHPTGERVVLDGESYRGRLIVTRTLQDGIAFGLDIPFVTHSGGMLDGLIRNWHDTWGLSNARRDVFEDYGLEYSYGRNDTTLHMLDQRGRGPGDLRLFLEWRPRSGSALQARRTVALRAGLKLPTGSAEELRGSGSTDLSLQVFGSDAESLSRWDVDLGWTASILWLGSTEVLSALRRDVVAIASAGASRPLWGRLSAIAQLDAHSAFYDSSLRSLGSASLQLSVGGRLAVGGGHHVDVAIVENLFTDATPDFGIHLRWHRTTFPRR